jgi:molybdopterin molybdotransferase
MKPFFQVTDLNHVLAMAEEVLPTDSEPKPLGSALGRVLAEPITAQEDVPPFDRATMDGFAVAAASTFGASEANPAYLNVTGRIAMGEVPSKAVGPGEAMKISTGGMLPPGADAVAMIEHAALLDETTIEIYRSVAPGQHVIGAGEDLRLGETLIAAGRRLRPQDAGLMAALGRTRVRVYRRPRVGIISTGDEVVPAEAKPGPGQIRDVNTHTLADLVRQAGAIPAKYGLVGDDLQRLKALCLQAAAENDMVLISGGSSLGMRDYTVEALAALPDSRIRAHGITISPGKPTILAQSGAKLVWGLPGHVTSAMVVFAAVVRPFLDRLSGVTAEVRRPPVMARLTRNLESAAGRVDFVRVRLVRGAEGEMLAEPILGKSGLIRTMVQADGLIAIDMNTEGLEKGDPVAVALF